MNKGIIFDWDGVIIDSAAQHERAWELLSAEIGKPLPPRHFQLSFGKKNQEIIPRILNWSNDPEEIANLSARKEELYRELVREDGVKVLPGAKELLMTLRSARIPRSLGSSTPRINLDVLFSVTGLGELFDAIVCGDDVTHGKPAPDVFLLAAQRLGLASKECLVIEDAHVGIEAAHNAGMKVIAVATTHPAAELQNADAVADSLLDLDVEFLLQME